MKFVPLHVVVRGYCVLPSLYYGILQIVNAQTCRVGALACMLHTLEIVSMKAIVDEILHV